MYATPNNEDELRQSQLIKLFLQLIWAEETERTLGKSAVTTSIIDSVNKRIDELESNRSDEGFRRDELWIQECGPPKTQAAYVISYIYKGWVEAQLKSFLEAASQENQFTSSDINNVDIDANTDGGEISTEETLEEHESFLGLHDDMFTDGYGGTDASPAKTTVSITTVEAMDSSLAKIMATNEAYLNHIH